MPKPIDPQKGIKIKGKVHKPTPDKDAIPVSITINGISKVFYADPEKLRERKEAREAEEARKEEAARFNQFRKDR
jgi:hypothetical protein